jgi:hypothetical protein
MMKENEPHQSHYSRDRFLIPLLSRRTGALVLVASDGVEAKVYAIAATAARDALARIAHPEVRARRVSGVETTAAMIFAAARKIIGSIMS